MQQRTMSRLHGFALIELLVVTAMITVLIALLLPAVQQSPQVDQRLHNKTIKQFEPSFPNSHDTDSRNLQARFKYQDHSRGASQSTDAYIVGTFPNNPSQVGD